MADQDDDIPTLGEMIFPGNPEKIVKKTTQVPASPPRQQRSGTSGAGREHVSSQSHNQSSTKPAAKPSNFEALISARVDHILQKHIEAAREEIVRMVMLELRSRLPNSPRKDK